MAKILMMAGSTIVVLSLLGFLVLLLKGRAVTKTSPVLMSLKALGIRPQRPNSDCVASGSGWEMTR